ncbi:PC-Esterase [Dillenia turbinata]|uniref:PC-Esterase n=1 Tax=Dillenia turbinata TaxID=194707 RepID=A0AAN8Z3D2_9MAGN
MILDLDAMPKFSEQWKHGAAVMLFNTDHWWLQKRPFDFFQYQGKLIKETPIGRALKLGTRTWASWIEANVDTRKTKVFFRSISPYHHEKRWCYMITEPLADLNSFVQIYPPSYVKVVEEVITVMKVHVTYLNITKLSQYRIDEHLSVYESPKNHARQRTNCSHWCVPGLPDTWNRLMYSSIVWDN